MKGEKVDNQPFDLAVDVNDSEEVESSEAEDEVGEMKQPAQQKAAATQGK